MMLPLELLGGDLLYAPGFIPAQEADRLFESLRNTIAWRQDFIALFGRRIPLPRETAWYGDGSYVYSGIRNRPQPWTSELAELRDRVAARAAAPFNSVLLNRYRDGRDAMGWHADDEPELGAAPVIASLSLGSTRTFQLRGNAEPRKRYEICLAHGSLLLMCGRSQHAYRHRIPRLAKAGDAGNGSI